MPWTLDITTFDVGQGESSFINADDGNGESRTMIIDGGLQAEGVVVNDNLDEIIGEGTPVDHILVSHYDDDHCEGIMALLAADNYSSICLAVATGTVDGAKIFDSKAKRVAAGTAAACAVFLGAYDRPGGAQDKYQARLAANSAAQLVDNNTPLATAAQIGIKEAELITKYNANPKLIPANSKKKRRDVSKSAGFAVADALGGNNTEAEVLEITEESIFDELESFITANYRFNTHGRYNTTNILDTGNTPGLPDGYINLVEGKVHMNSNVWIQAPGINRQRSTPNLGAEILWNSGPQAQLAPAGSPMIFTMARRSQVWNWNGVLGHAIDNNNDCFGVILRFNKFFFYTGGDLIAEGEDIIAQKVRNVGLPDPNSNNPFPVATRIAAFKCGHHGAETSTSQTFLDRALPRAALISCGDNSYDHPRQVVVNRLHAMGGLSYFYLTGCPKYRNYIPATYTPMGNQLTAPGNKSRVAGGIADPPGDITLSIDTDGSNAVNADERIFYITYYDYDAPIPGYRVEAITF